MVGLGVQKAAICLYLQTKREPKESCELVVMLYAFGRWLELHLDVSYVLIGLVVVEN